MVSSLRSAATATALACAAALPAGAQAASPVPPVPPVETVSARATPVSVAGLWCGAGLLHNYVLEIAQQYQFVKARLIRRERVHELTGRMDGAILRADPQRDHTMDLLADGNELRIIAGTGILALTKGQFFTRAAGGSCSH